MLPVETPRLRFREMTDDDLPLLLNLLGDPEVMRYYPSPKTAEEVGAWIAWNQRNYAEHGYGLWIIETNEGEFIGDCGLTWQRVNGVAGLEVGYHVIAAEQGRGYATEAARACLDHTRDVIGVRELVAILHPENRASERVAEKLGMQRVQDDLGGSIPLRRVLSVRFPASGDGAARVLR